MQSGVKRQAVQCKSPIFPSFPDVLPRSPALNALVHILVGLMNLFIE
jgi:hypothetical protein